VKPEREHYPGSTPVPGRTPAEMAGLTKRMRATSGAGQRQPSVSQQERREAGCCRQTRPSAEPLEHGLDWKCWCKAFDGTVAAEIRTGSRRSTTFGRHDSPAPDLPHLKPQDLVLPRQATGSLIEAPRPVAAKRVQWDNSGPSARNYSNGELLAWVRRPWRFRRPRWRNARVRPDVKPIPWISIGPFPT